MRDLFLQACRRAAAALAIISTATGAQATATINTYSFTQAGYAIILSRNNSTGPGTLSGTFTGTINALGQWQASDLSSLSLTFSYPTMQGTISGNVGTLADLSLFSFNTDTSGDLVILAQQGNATTCVGAAATLSSRCNPGGLNPAGTLGVALLEGLVIGDTTQAPVITLVSSVTSAPALPEPSTWAMMLFGFGAMGGALRRRKRSAARLAQGAEPSSNFEGVLGENREDLLCLLSPVADVRRIERASTIFASPGPWRCTARTQ